MNNLFHKFSTASKYAAKCGGIVYPLDRAIIMPLKNDMYLCLEYVYNTGCFSSSSLNTVKILYCGSRLDVYIDCIYAGKTKSIKLSRNSTAYIKYDLNIRETITVDICFNRKTKIDFSLLKVNMYAKTETLEYNVNDLVTAVGWIGKLTYSDCKRKLKRVQFDDKTTAVYINLPSATNFPFLNSMFLVVDYDKSNIDIKIVSTSKIFEGAVKQYGIDMTTIKKQKSSTRYYPDGKLICNSTYKCFESAQLDDVSYNIPFCNKIVRIFKLAEICSFKPLEILNIQNVNYL
jgi:hypothetical protein